jgi:cytochrome c-type biogenesis protein CcmH/NrfG
MINDMVAGLEDRLRGAPDDLDGWRRLARAYDVLGRSQDAERAHGRVLALAPGDAQALWRLGEIAADRGDPAQARRRWEALEQSLPRGSQERRRVREAIEAL